MSDRVKVSEIFEVMADIGRCHEVENSFNVSVIQMRTEV